MLQNQIKTIFKRALKKSDSKKEMCQLYSDFNQSTTSKFSCNSVIIVI